MAVSSFRKEKVPQELLPELGQVSTWIGNLTRHALPRILRLKKAEVKPTSELEEPTHIVSPWRN